MEDVNVKEIPYVEKLKKGRESPQQVPAMQVVIKRHKHWNKPSNYVDITFTNYAATIGTKQWVAIGITVKSIYFTFFDRWDKATDRFKLMPIGRVQDYKFGDPLVVNLTNKKYLQGYCSDLAYPVYYIESMDTYKINLDDSKRTPLFNTNISQNIGEIKMPGRRSFKIDCAKFIDEVAKLKLHKSYARMSRDMGVSEGVISNSLKRGSMSYEIADKLEKKYKIRRCDYELVIPDTKKDEQEVITDSKTYDKISKIEFAIAPETEQKLYDIVNRAVYEAVKRVLNE